MTLRSILLKRGVKAIVYRPLSVLVQIAGLGLITGTWKFTLPLLGIDVIITGLYYLYDVCWEKWVIHLDEKSRLAVVLLKRGAKAIVYRPLSIFVQIVGLGLLTQTWSFVYPLLGIDVIVFTLYYLYDVSWERWVMTRPTQIRLTLKGRDQNPQRSSQATGDSPIGQQENL